MKVEFKAIEGIEREREKKRLSNTIIAYFPAHLKLI
jgi:hypothetical protein